MSDPIEVTTKYATTVDDLPAAWLFIMARIESVGDHPHIEIRPISVVGAIDMVRALDGDEEPLGEWRKRFEVVVSGMVAEASR